MGGCCNQSAGQAILRHLTGSCCAPGPAPTWTWAPPLPGSPVNRRVQPYLLCPPASLLVLPLYPPVSHVRSLSLLHTPRGLTAHRCGPAWMKPRAARTSLHIQGRPSRSLVSQTCWVIAATQELYVASPTVEEEAGSGQRSVLALKQMSRTPPGDRATLW